MRVAVSPAGVHTAAMLVFIDESGDPGFKVARGSSPVFVAAMVMFNGREQATDAEKVVREALRALNVSPEFKFNKCSHDTRDQFFLAIRRCISMSEQSL
jgi:hypothetical protein